MSDAINVRKISKYYRINHESTPSYGSFRDSLAGALRRPLSLITGKSTSQERFWALKDISFDLKPGDVLGIIGRNGSGKSTLLKILSRIVEPASGEAILRGRVASLLEVGTGFHPELTGRENIFFNGAILGMTRKEIEEKFDEIVAFSEIEQFLDTPVKFYSSGMYVRLAFAVAAHLEPDVLIVDEVLAVGDAEFQKKCLGKMKNVAGQGRTVVFVSHNMNAVAQLCNKGLYLKKGEMQGGVKPINESINDYLSSSRAIDSSEWIGSKKFTNSYFEPARLAITDKDGRTRPAQVDTNDANYIQIEGKINDPNPNLKLGYTIYNEDGFVLYTSSHTDTGEEAWPELKKGHFVLRSQLPQRLLNEGEYTVELTSSIHNRAMLSGLGVDGPIIKFKVSGQLSDSPHYVVAREGIIAPIISWEYTHVK